MSELAPQQQSQSMLVDHDRKWPMNVTLVRVPRSNYVGYNDVHALARSLSIGVNLKLMLHRVDWLR